MRIAAAAAARRGALRRAHARRGFTSAPPQNLQTKPSKSISDSTIDDLASRPLHPLTLDDLVRHGSPPLSPQSLYDSANFSLSVLPVRLAHRIRALRNLPFIVVTNPHIAQIHNNYMHSLSTLLPWASGSVSTPEQEESFTEIMSGLVQTHTNTIPTLARGFLESRKYISAEAITAFLDKHLRARIGTRLVAEQQIALHYSSKPQPTARDALWGRKNEHAPIGSYIGIIDTQLRPAVIIQQCESFVSELCELSYGVRPSLILNGDPETRIAHIPVHLEYIVTELLKNAFRATVENGTEREPIEVTIAPSPDDSPKASATTRMRGTSSASAEQRRDRSPGASDTAAASANPPTDSVPSKLENPDVVSASQFSGASSPGVTIRIRDRGGGISPGNLTKLWDYGFTTFSEHQASAAAAGVSPGGGSSSSTSVSGSSSSHNSANTDALNVISASGAAGSTLAGLGYGLPLGRAYAEYFGGGIAVQSLWGWGADVYVTLRGVGSLS